MSEIVNASLVGKSSPNIKGDRKMDHKVIRVYCSSSILPRQCARIYGFH